MLIWDLVFWVVFLDIDLFSLYRCTFILLATFGVDLLCVYINKYVTTVQGGDDHRRASQRSLMLILHPANFQFFMVTKLLQQQQQQTFQ